VIEYPVALAVEDFVPVVLTPLGIVLLTRHVDTRSRAGVLLAAVLVGAGGLAKASWKLTVALGGPDVTWLANLLFPLLTLGYGLLAWILISHHHSRRPQWVLPVLAGVSLLCAGAALAAGSMLPLLISTTVFSTLSGIHLILAAQRNRDSLTAALFGVQLLGFFILSPLASRADQTIALQWVEQLSNSVAQAAFAIAAYRLSRTPRLEAVK